MDLVSLAALAAAGIVGLASLVSEGRYFLERRIKLILFLAAIAVFSINGYFVFRQYEVWSGDAIGQFFLPPHQSISYFILYSLARFFSPYLVSLGIALLFLQAAKVFNRRSGEKFFEKEEPYLAALALFLVGHPGWLVYLVILILAYLLLHATYYLLQRKTIRLPLYRLWMPAAFFVILVNEYWLSSREWWSLLNF